jgi:hypothetical protein
MSQWNRHYTFVNGDSMPSIFLWPASLRQFSQLDSSSITHVSVYLRKTIGWLCVWVEGRKTGFFFLFLALSKDSSIHDISYNFAFNSLTRGQTLAWGLWGMCGTLSVTKTKRAFSSEFFLPRSRSSFFLTFRSWQLSTMNDTAKEKKGDICCYTSSYTPTHTHVYILI